MSAALDRCSALLGEPNIGAFLFDVPVTLSPSNLVKRAITQIKSARKLSLRLDSGIESGAQLAHLIVGKSCSISRVLISAAHSPFGHCVPDVVALRSEEKMLRIHTRRIVAPMANEQAAGDRPPIKLPSNTMSLQCFSATGYRSVAKVKLTPGPFVASVWRQVNSLLKTLSESVFRAASLIAYLAGERTKDSRHPSPLVFKCTSAELTIWHVCGMVT
jgi:hypothetical protein